MKKGLITLLIFLGVTTWATGQVTGSYFSDGGTFAVFDGVDDYLSAGDHFKYYTTSFTIEAWVYRDGWTAPNSEQAILSTTNNGGYAIILKDDGNLSFKLWRDSESAYEYFDHDVTGLDPGWHHIAVSAKYEAGTDKDEVSLYVDGSRKIIRYAIGTLRNYDADNSFIIGADAGPSATPEGYYFEGAIDEVRIWGTDLTTSQVSTWKNKIITDSDNPAATLPFLHGYFKMDTGWANGFLDDASDNLNGANTGDWDLSGSNYTTDNIPRLVSSYYRVGHLDHLVWMDGSPSDGRLAADYKQTNDIDASASSLLNSGAGFNPIGSSTTKFSGSYDGSNYSISGLTIDSNLQIGLFYQLFNAQVSDLTLSSLDFTSTLSYVGALAGKATGTSSISNVIVSDGSSVSGATYTGGLVGKCEDDVTISGSKSYATVTTNSSDYVGGLVGYAIENVQFTDCLVSADVTGHNNTGGFIGYAANSVQFLRCNSSGVIKGNSATGGFIGFAGGGSFSQCYYTSNDSVSGSSEVGGFIGSAGTTASFDQCANRSGKVHGTGDNIGGFVGKNRGIISNSYAMGNVSGDDNVGGFVGISSSGEITNCYSIGSATGSDYVGGFVGIYTSGTFSNLFWDTENSGMNFSTGSGSPTNITGKSEAQMTTIATFSDLNSDGLTTSWDFVGNPFDDSSNDDKWDMATNLNSGYPDLTYLFPDGHDFSTTIYTKIPVKTNASSGSAGGFVRDNASSTARGICWSSSGDAPTISDSHTDDGTGTGNFTSAYSDLTGSYPYYVRAYFTSGDTQYGDVEIIYPTLAHTVTEPAIDDSGVYQIASLENLGWISANENRWYYEYKQTANIDASATSAWYNNEGFMPLGNLNTRFTGSYDGNSYTISNLTVNRSSRSYQGMFGYPFKASITKVQLIDIDVDGDDYSGGLIGRSDSTTVSQCYTTGSIVGGSVVGGLAGKVVSSSVINSYSRVNVNGSMTFAGLIGVNHSSNCTNSYSTGSVRSIPTGGGLIASTLSGGTTTNCFWDTQTSGYSSSDGGTGKTTAEMKDYNTFIAAGWDFVSESANGNSDYWDADQVGNVNNGYVILSNQSGADNSLPVELSFFKAEDNKNKVLLTWKTESETENMGFIIETRLKGDEFWLELDNFTHNAALEGQGSTSQSQSYAYTDTKAMAGFTHEYRLSDVDYAGKITQHSTIEILLPESHSLLLPGQFALQAMYPNPFNPSLNIRYETGEATQVSVTIFDLQGRELMTLTDDQHQSGSHELVWQADHLPSGVYLVQVKSNRGLVLKKVTLLK